VRAFVAIPVGSDPIEGPPDHLTLRFLGEIDPARVDGLSARIAPAVASVGPFDLTLDGVGAFPSGARPRVVWRAVTVGADRVRELAERVARAATESGFPPEPGPFVPHVTLFRVRSPRDVARARAVLEGRSPPPRARTVRVAVVELLESTFEPSGRVHHRSVRRFPLEGAQPPTAPGG
jgi:RNA 2',3'-cyclic 3'-phosphodiesterase